jgi:hypothetical protein
MDKFEEGDYVFNFKSKQYGKVIYCIEQGSYYDIILADVIEPAGPGGYWYASDVSLVNEKDAFILKLKYG